TLRPRAFAFVLRPATSSLDLATRTREVRSCSTIPAVQPRRGRLAPRAGPPDAACPDPYTCRPLLGNTRIGRRSQEVAVPDRHFLSRPPAAVRRARNGSDGG